MKNSWCGAFFCRCGPDKGEPHLLAQLDDGVPSVAGLHPVAIGAKLVAHGVLNHENLLQNGARHDLAEKRGGEKEGGDDYET